jgi:exopolyphosphatase / guanosine-5'-triphosphate,3'-diphosphate pyrophosphatase
MLCACIDIGSNTTRVLVAEAADGRIAEVLQRRAFTRIGSGLGTGGAIAAAKLDEVARVVAEQVAVARDAGVARGRLRVVGTAAIRGAANGAELCAAIQERAGVRVEILDGEQEARLAFLGATRTLPGATAGRIGVADVGGGSSEIAIGTVSGGVDWWRSFALGSGALTDDHVRGDPPTASELEAIRARAGEAFGGLGLAAPDRAVAVGGSATSLHRLVGAVLEPAALARAIEVLAGASCDDVARRHGLDPVRVRLLPAGILVLDAISRALGRPLEVGCGGLREGVCLELSRVGS